MPRSNNAARFNKIVADEDSFIVVGHTYKKDEDKSTSKYNYLDYRGIIVKYNTDLEKKANNKENGEGIDYFSDVIITDDGYLIGGASSSKELGSNNKAQKAWTGEMIKESCIPIKVDRLGMLISINGKAV